MSVGVTVCRCLVTIVALMRAEQTFGADFNRPLDPAIPLDCKAQLPPESQQLCRSSPIQYAQIFDKNISDEKIRQTRGIVWGAPHTIPGVTALFYAPASRLFGPPPQGAHSWTEWLYTLHPDWIVYKADGTTIAYEFGDERYPPFDISNSAAISQHVVSIQKGAEAYQGVGLDNVSAANSFGAAVVYLHPTHVPCVPADRPSCGGQYVRKWSGATDGTDLAYMASNVSYLKHLHEYLNAKKKIVICNNNVSAGRNAHWNGGVGILCDGNMDEGFVYHGCKNGRPDFMVDRTWARIEQADAESAKAIWIAVAYTCNGNVTNWSPDEANWTIGNYLLMMENGKRNFLSIAPKKNASYVDYPHYLRIDVGSFTQAPPAANCAPVCRRTFANGFVVVNPSSSESGTFVVTQKNCHDMWGRPLGRGLHTISSASAIVANGCTS